MLVGIILTNSGRKIVKAIVDASDLLKEAVERRKIHMSLLVADTALWASPEFHQRLLRETESVALFPNVRRARLGQGERRGQIVDGGVRLDDNSYANLAIKRATGLGKSAKGFEACHIWPLTCYKERYHTAVANLVLLPRALAGLTDHDIEIQKALQYRAFELYGWHPEERPQPVKPTFYPTEWRNPLTDPAVKIGTEPVSKEKDRNLQSSIERWSRKPDSNVHKIIALVVLSGEISRNQLVEKITKVTSSKRPSGALASLLTNGGNAYGRVLTAKNGLICIHPEVESQIRAHDWYVR